MCYDVTAETKIHLNLTHPAPIFILVLLKFVMQIFFSFSFYGEVRQKGNLSLILKGIVHLAKKAEIEIKQIQFHPHLLNI